MAKTARYNSFSDEGFSQKVAESISMQDLQRRLGYQTISGGSYQKIYKRIEDLGLDISHWTGQGWNKGNYDYSRYKKNSKIGTGLRASAPIIALRGHKCENCGLEEWNGIPIPLQIHHKDGDHYNNELTNILLLCPNCHAQTNTYCNKKGRVQSEITDEEILEALLQSKSINDTIFTLKVPNTASWYSRIRKVIIENNFSFSLKKTPTITYCNDCGCEITNNTLTGLCQKCYAKSTRKVERPKRDELKILIRSKSFLEIGRLYGVTDNAIRKWCDQYNLPRKKSIISSYSDEEWEKI